LKVPFLDLERQHSIFRKEIIDAVTNVLDSSQFILGREVENFENEFSEYIGVKYCYGVGNGTDALRLALISCDINKDDEVLIPANTFISAALETSFIGAKPVFIDIDEKTYNIDPDKILKAITKKTKAIILTHLFGQPAKIDDVLQIAYKYNLKIIEDACQAHGAEYKGKKVGSFGDVGCFSFYPSKNMGALGDGGAVVCNDKKVARKIFLLRNYGEIKKYNYLIKGFNSRLDPIHAAILRIKLKNLDKFNDNRIRHANLYKCLLKDIKEVTLPEEINKIKHVFYVFVVKVKKRDQLINYLNEKGVKTLIHYPVPIHLQKSFKELGYKKGDFPTTEKCAKHILSLPMFPEIKDEEIKYVTKCIREFYSRF